MATNQLPTGGSVTTATKPCPLGKKAPKVLPDITVTPVIAAEYLAVLFDRGLTAKQGKETKHPATGTYVNLSLTQAPATPKLKTAKIKLVADPADKIEVYENAGLSKKLDLSKPIAIGKLTGTNPYKVWVKGVAKGTFDLKLHVESPIGAGANFTAAADAVVAMGVVELGLGIHEYTSTDLDGYECDPDTTDIPGYYTALKDKDLPDQTALGDPEKVQVGRLLHVQDSMNAGRAKLLLAKLTAADWPAGTDDYSIVVRASDSADEARASTALKVFDAEKDGAEKALPYKIKVSALKAAEIILWVEGTSESAKARDVRLELALERDAGAPDPQPKRNGDWGVFTVVKIDEVKLDYTAPKGEAAAWNEAKEQFFINLKDGDDGRKIKLRAKLTKKLKDVTLHFALAPDVNNAKTANWGVDLPGTWPWKDLAPALKQKDRTARNKILHVKADTDAKGEASAEVLLSQFGGDRFTPAAYIRQDPHLAKFVDGHGQLGTRKPTLAKKKLNVWRKFWYQPFSVQGVAVQGYGNAADAYRKVKVEMVASKEVVISRSDANKITPKCIYPKHMVNYYRGPTNAYVNNFPGDTGDGLVVGDNNEKKFFGKKVKKKDEPVMVPMMNVHGLWIADGDTGAESAPREESTTFPVSLTMDKKVINPPLQGGDLLVSGTWEAQDWRPPVAEVVATATVAGTPAVAGAWINRRTGNLANGDIELDPNRSDPRAVRVKVPAGVVVASGGGKKTRITIKDVVVRGAATFLGTSYDDGIVNKFTPNDMQDFINTINHELGHSFKQVKTGPPTGVPAHPHQYVNQGSHCSHATDKCLMYQSGPIAGSLNEYCPVCHPYVLIEGFRLA